MGCWYTQESAPSRLVPLMSALILCRYSHACNMVTCEHAQKNKMGKVSKRERSITRAAAWHCLCKHTLLWQIEHYQMPQLPCEGSRELNELVSNKECANMHTLAPVLPPEITPWINMPDRRE